MTKQEALEQVANRNGFDSFESMLNIWRGTKQYEYLLEVIEEYGDSRYSDGQDNSLDSRGYHFGGM